MILKKQKERLQKLIKKLKGDGQPNKEMERRKKERIAACDRKRREPKGKNQIGKRRNDTCN